MGELNDINNHISLRILRFSMRLMGMWPVEDSRGQFISNIVLFYTICTVMIGFIIEIVDFYYSWGNLHAISYNLPPTITILIELVKLIKFTINRSEVVSLNAQTEKTFWKMTYETEDLHILKACNRKSMRIIVTHIFFSQCVVWLYVSIPIVESVGKNVSDRTLPLTLHFNFPYTRSPYYEIAFILESAATVGVGICAATFAGFLGITNFYAAGQFKILQRKLERCICDVETINVDESIIKVNIAQNYTNIRNCIKRHQILILYVKKVENLFNMILLTQALGSVLLLSFCGFQLLLGEETSILRMSLSVQFLLAAMVQLSLFAWPCHEIMVESQEIASAAYRSSWFCLPHSKVGRICRKSLLIIIARARKPCIVTAGKFAPMSLQTLTLVFNKAISYFTILRQMNEM